MSNHDYYANTAVRLDTIIGDASITWMRINRAKVEYDEIGNHQESFYVWLQQTYGVKLQFTPTGELQLSNEIVDHHKYTIFLLKFAHEDRN